MSDMPKSVKRALLFSMAVAVVGLLLLAFGISA